MKRNCSFSCPYLSKEKQFYFKNCTAFVFPSLREGFGLPVIEAMRFGKPIFISNNTSLPEIGGRYDFYWNNFEPKEMAETLIQRLHMYNENRVEYVWEHTERTKSFNWDSATQDYIKVNDHY